MSHLKGSVLLLTSLLLAAGPAVAASGNESGEQSSTAEQWNQTMEALASYSAKQRDKALEAGKETLDAMDRRLDKMETWTKKHWNELSEEARQERSEMLAAMRRQRNDVAEWYGGMKHSSSETWESVKQGFIKSYDKLQNAYQDAVDSFQSESAENGDTAAQ